jgi:hypothetical protein
MDGVSEGMVVGSNTEVRPSLNKYRTSLTITGDRW